VMYKPVLKFADLQQLQVNSLTRFWVIFATTNHWRGVGPKASVKGASRLEVI
jgi:hypothetical protein